MVPQGGLMQEACSGVVNVMLTRLGGAFHAFAGGFFHAQDTPALFA